MSSEEAGTSRDQDVAPGISVLIATKDRWPLLRRAVEAVWAQDYPGAIELIVVVDGELPAAPDVPLPRHPDRQQLRVLTNTSSAGVAGARNTGTAQASHEYVAFCDDDDVWRPHRLSAQRELLRDHPETVLVGGGICIDNGSDRADRLWPRQDVTLADLLASRVMELHPSTFLMRTQALRDVGGIDEEIPGAYAEDYDLLIRLARRGPIRMVDDVIVDVYWQGQSFFFSRWATISDALQYLIDKHPEFAAHPRGLARIEGQIAFAEAAQRRRTESWRWSARALRRTLREPRVPLALAVSSGIVRPERVQSFLHARGRGI